MPQKMIVVNQPYMPSEVEYHNSVTRKIWKSGWLTNFGPMENELREELRSRMGLDERHDIILCNNATNALMISAKVLFERQAKIITTPYTFIAGAQALTWNDLDPIYVDIDPNSLNISPAAVERASDNAGGIFGLHAYGNTQGIESIVEIGASKNIPVLYDAAHCISWDKEASISLTMPDISVISMHATKALNAGEGAIIVCRKKYAEQLRALSNFGLNGDKGFLEYGMNAKLCELSAGLGLLNIRQAESKRNRRRQICDFYTFNLSKVADLYTIRNNLKSDYPYTYFPILDVEDVDDKIEKLKSHGILCRRYFYPIMTGIFSNNRVEDEKLQEIPISRTSAEGVMCIPCHSELSDGEINFVAEKLIEVL